MRSRAALQGFRAPVLAALLALGAGCASQPATAFSFDTAPGGWEFDRHRSAGGTSAHRYTHPVHEESLEVFEVARPAPGATSAEFNALPPAQRALPTLGDATTTMRPLGDDELGGAQGYWVAQYGRDGGAELRAAALVVPNGRRHFVVRLASREDEIEQLQGWLRDTVLRNFRFPAPQR
ncbi:MAG: hypothetical protein U0324_09185 [Polyangiales bacterium]